MPGARARREKDDPPLSLEEFARMPEEDAYRIELVRGRLVREPRPMSLHARVTVRLAYELEAYARRSGLGTVLGDMGFVLEEAPPTVRGPDVAFVTHARIPTSGYAEGFWHFGPDLAVEVLSPSNRSVAMREKVEQYLAAGSRLVWVVDPRKRTVRVHEASGVDASLIDIDGTLTGEPVLPGFSLQMRTLFSL